MNSERGFLLMGNRSRQAALEDAGENDQLRGSFSSVLLIGGFILISWAVVFALYLVRQ
jgi:hypothetical protein